MKSRLLILYEDSERTLKLMSQMSTSPRISEVEIQMMDAGLDSAIIAATAPQQNDPIGVTNHGAAKGIPMRYLFSRCSGSYKTRGHDRSPCIIESIIFAAEQTPSCRVLNGCKAFRLEMNKSLALFHMQCDTYLSKCRQHHVGGRQPVLVPTAVLVTKLNGKVVHQAMAKHGLGSDCFVKGIVGGGSTSVAYLDARASAAKSTEYQLAEINREMRSAGASSDVFVLQKGAPCARPGVQYRFELIGGRFHYAVRIDTSAKANDAPSNSVDNLCMCDIADGDLGVSLHIIKSAAELAREDGMCASLASAKSIIACLELLAQDFDLFVVAIEGTLHDGSFHVFDVNTNSNYNHALEIKHDVTPGAWQILESILGGV